MNALSHKSARRLMHIPEAELSSLRQVELANHLDGCPDCQAYADGLRELQQKLTRALDTRWGDRYQPKISSRLVLQRWEEGKMNRQNGKLITILSGFAVVLVLIIYGPGLFSSFLAAILTPKQTPAYPTAAPTQPATSAPSTVTTVTPAATLRPLGAGEIAPRSSLSAHSNLISDLDYSPDGKYLASASWDYTVKTWNLSTNHPLLTIGRIGSQPDDIAFSPDGTRLAVSYASGDTKLLSPLDGNEIISLPSNKSPICLDFSPDGSLLAVGYHEGTVYLWDLNTGQVSLTLKGQPDIINGVDFSPDGKRLLTASGDGTAKVWDAANGTLLLTLEMPDDLSFIYAGKFSPDGKRIVTAGRNSKGEVWDAATGDLLFELVGHTGEIYDVEYSPDGKLLATAGEDGTARIWDASTGKQILSLVGHYGLVENVEFSPDGKSLATSGKDGTIKFWDLPQ
jgi:WD40 repeat protein